MDCTGVGDEGTGSYLVSARGNLQSEGVTTVQDVIAFYYLEVLLDLLDVSGARGAHEPEEPITIGTINHPSYECSDAL